MGKDFQTPMMRQWSELKAQAGRHLLFFRLGDFYELFDHDAEVAAPVLGIVLTSRNQKSPDAVALCGIPLHQFENYIGRLLDRGFSVALAEQTEEAGGGKNLVRREIVQYFTPGIRLLTQDERPHYCAYLYGDLRDWNLAAADVSTGVVSVYSGNGLEEAQELIDRLPIQDFRTASKNFSDLKVTWRDSAVDSSLGEATEEILKGLRISDLQDSPAKTRGAILALGGLLKVLREAHPRDSLQFFSLPPEKDLVTLNAATRRNLNLFEPAGRSFFETIDRTKTAFGKRELKRMVESPTRNRDELVERQQIIRFFKNETFVRKKFRERLASVLDLHRLLRRLGNPKDLFKIGESLSQAVTGLQLIPDSGKLIRILNKKKKNLLGVTQELERCLQWSELEESGWVKKGVLPELDELRELESNSQILLSQLEEKMREDLKISTLKIKRHQVFGYVFEVTASHKEKIPTSLKKVQSLANAERFKSKELEELEEKLLSLSSRIEEAEKAEIERLASLVHQEKTLLIDFTNDLARLDALQSLAEISVENSWITPETLDGQSSLKATDACHPMISQFVPLSLSLDQQRTSLMLLTGPNMAGKSTLLRVSALLALMHQIGSDVPAKEFKASLFDRIMCRMGAQDDLVSGQSTFFVEMREVSQMLSGATSESLLVFDEIGRGTSTYDGMSLAWAITEEVHAMGCISFVATHYLELSDLEKKCPRLKSFHLGVEDHDGRLIFTRKLVEGPASRSYGIQVAQLADLPKPILARAKEKLGELENKRTRGLPLFEWRA